MSPLKSTSGRNELDWEKMRVYSLIDQFLRYPPNPKIARWKRIGQIANIAATWLVLILLLLVLLRQHGWAQISGTYGQFNVSFPTLSDGQFGILQLDSSGRLIINCGTGCAAGGGGTSSNFGAAFPAAGTAIGVKNGLNMVNLTADGSNNLNVNINANSFGT